MPYRNDLISLHEKINSILFIVMYVLIIIGFIVYFNKKHKKYKTKFSIFKFIFDIKKCIQ